MWAMRMFAMWSFGHVERGDGALPNPYWEGQTKSIGFAYRQCQVEAGQGKKKNLLSDIEKSPIDRSATLNYGNLDSDFLQKDFLYF